MYYHAVLDILVTITGKYQIIVNLDNKQQNKV